MTAAALEELSNYELCVGERAPGIIISTVCMHQNPAAHRELYVVYSAQTTYSSQCAAGFWCITRNEPGYEARSLAMLS